MPAYTPSQIKSKTAMARKVVKHHFGKSLEKIEFKPAGKTNFVFDVVTKDGNFIVRIANSRAKLNDFMKEQWATQKALSIGVPVPEILSLLLPAILFLKTLSRFFSLIVYFSTNQILSQNQ